MITGGGGAQEYFNMMPQNENIWIESALYSPAMVRDAVDVAVNVLDGKTEEKVKIIPTTIVDRTNCAKFKDDKISLLIFSSGKRGYGAAIASSEKETE